MNGTAPGIATVLKICQSDAQNARAARSRSASVARTPPIVFTSTGKKAEMNTMNTLDHMPMPNQMMISGTIATRGRCVERVHERVEDHRELAVPADHHAQHDAGRDRQANANREVLPAVEQIVLEQAVVQSSRNRLAIAEGPVKNSGEIRPVDHRACHAAIASSTAAPPRISRFVPS